MTEPDNPFELTTDEIVKLTMAFILGNDGTALESDIATMLEEAQHWKVDKCFLDAAVAGVCHLKRNADGDLCMIANPEWPNVPDYTKPAPWADALEGAPQ